MPYMEKEMRYAISSHHATTFSGTCFTYLMLRSGFEKLANSVTLLRRAEKRFNDSLLFLAKTALNTKLVGPHLFDAIELHLTDPRMFCNPFEWKISDKMIDLIGGPIASFHAHIERNPLLGRYTFNLSEISARVKRAIESQLEVAYRIMYADPNLVVTDNPVLVFHAGIARDGEDREKALARSRESIEFIAVTNKRLYEEYGRDRKIIPTIENSPNDRLWLCQTIDEWKQETLGFTDEVKLTLDYGHILTVDGEWDRLSNELRDGKMGDDIVNLHLHYSPEVDHTIRHAHAPLSKIPQSKLQCLRDNLKQIMEHTGVEKQGYVTLEVPSRNLVDYMPWLQHAKRRLSLANRFLKGTGFFASGTDQGTMEDQLASLRIVKEMVEQSMLETLQSSPTDFAVSHA